VTMSKMRPSSTSHQGPGKAGFRLIRQGKKHVVMTNGTRFLTIPRNNPINSYTMGGIVKDAGLSKEDFLALL